MLPCHVQWFLYYSGPCGNHDKKHYGQVSTSQTKSNLSHCPIKNTAKQLWVHTLCHKSAEKMLSDDAHVIFSCFGGDMGAHCGRQWAHQFHLWHDWHILFAFWHPKCLPIHLMGTCQKKRHRNRQYWWRYWHTYIACHRCQQWARDVAFWQEPIRFFTF